MYLSETSIPKIVAVAEEMAIASNETLLLMFAEKSEIDYPQLIEALNQLSISFFGGIFPGIIYGEAHYEVGCVFTKFSVHQHPKLIRGLHQEDFELSNLSDWARVGHPKPTILTFVDGLTSNIAGYLTELSDELGNSSNFLGGGAGSLSLVQQPCIITPEGIFQDAAVMCLLDFEATLCAKHGWAKLVGPFVATRTHKNIIHELNWKNAFSTYKEIVDKDNGKPIRSDNFFEIAKSYPFGIYKENSEDIVRDPIIGNEQGELICVGEVPENTTLYILKGEKNALIDSAKQAIEACLARAEKSIQHLFIVDCISRTLFLENDFPKELQAINSQCRNGKQGAAKPIGILSLGEISSTGDGLLEFYNKTVVVGALY